VRRQTRGSSPRAQPSMERIPAAPFCGKSLQSHLRGINLSRRRRSRGPRRRAIWERPDDTWSPKFRSCRF
jgi:hypothetical protein